MSAREPFLTIGIASYNYAGYLDKAFRQIEKQKFRDFEILYCDDGSTDNSVHKIKRYIADRKDMSIRLIEGSHEGILANRNRIIAHAKGKYLMICDADDYMLDGCLAALCGAAEENHADCVIGGFCEISDKGRVIKRHVPAGNSSKWLYTWHHAQIYRTDIVRENGISFKQIPDDVFYLQTVHRFCQKTCFVSQNIYAWRRHVHSASNGYEPDSEWHPVNLWKRIAVFIADLKKGRSSEDGIILTYYLYKWYYLNIADLWQGSHAQVKNGIKKMQYIMRKAVPDYQYPKLIREALSAPDTASAKIAVFLCWMLEKLRLTYILVVIRKVQNRLR